MCWMFWTHNELQEQGGLQAVMCEAISESSPELSQPKRICLILGRAGSSGGGLKSLLRKAWPRLEILLQQEGAGVETATPTQQLLFSLGKWAYLAERSIWRVCPTNPLSSKFWFWPSHAFDSTGPSWGMQRRYKSLKPDPWEQSVCDLSVPLSSPLPYRLKPAKPSKTWYLQLI